MLVDCHSFKETPTPLKKSILGTLTATVSIKPLSLTLIAVEFLVKSKSPAVLPAGFIELSVFVPYAVGENTILAFSVSPIAVRITYSPIDCICHLNTVLI